MVQSRKPTGKKPGGQSGHKGSTLAFAEHPDQVVVHAPPVKAQVTEHQAQIKACSYCGAQTRGQFSVGLNSPIQYGTRIRASLIYLKDYALLPFQRSVELMQDLFGVPICAETLANI